MQTTGKMVKSFRFAGVCASNLLKAEPATVSVSVVLLALLPLVAAAQDSASVSPSTMPAIATIDDRFESYNVEMAEVIGVQ
jgi:hypothetical protein